MSRECLDGQTSHASVGGKVLKPYVESAPEGIVPLLLLDSYHCHVMASVVNEIQGLGVQVEHIPGGCTYLCQTVDIGINKPYKKHMRRQWELWMISEGMVKGTTSPPSREHLLALRISVFGLMFKYGLRLHDVRMADGYQLHFSVERSHDDHRPCPKYPRRELSERLQPRIGRAESEQIQIKVDRRGCSVAVEVQLEMMAT